MVQVTISGSGELKSSETDIIEGLVVNNHDLVGVLDQLMDREGSIVWFDDCVGDFWRWEDREGGHDSIWIFLSDF